MPSKKLSGPPTEPHKKPKGARLLDAFLKKIGDARAWAKEHGISESHLSRLRRGQRSPSTLMRAHLAKATDGKVSVEAWA
jgi:hypothetical protein